MKVFLAAVTIAGLSTVPAGFANAAGACPADPVKASFQVWPAGELKMSEEETAVHPCGKKISCHGGNPRRGIQRRCEWL